MTDPREWDEQHLYSLPVGEFDWLEVKGRRGLDLTLPAVKEHDVRENLARAVSAFANSGGGVLVLGMENPKDQWQVDDGGIDLAVKRPGTREWLEDVIPHLVDYPLGNFNVYEVHGTTEGTQISPGRGVFLIHIPDSEQAPHQSAVDQRYYARVGGKSRPLPHRLVADIFNRRRDPQLDLHFWIETEAYSESGPLAFTLPGERPRRRIDHTLLIQAVNVGRVYAQYVNLILYLPLPLVPEDRRRDGEFKEVDGVKYYVWHRANSRRDVVKYEVMGASQYGPSWFDPLLPGRTHTWRFGLPETFTPDDTWGQTIRWEIYADNAIMRTGSVRADSLEHEFGER